MKTILIAASLSILAGSAAQAKPLHDEIPPIFQGTWAPTLEDCADLEGVNRYVVDGESVNYYEANDYLLIGIKFSGTTTGSDGSGTLFNGRFTSRSEAFLLGENNIRMEIDDRDHNVMYLYPIGDDGEPMSENEVRGVRCVGR